MESIIIFVHVIAAIAITGLVLIQQGKGADMGASFGSGSSQTIFGSSGSGNVLSKSTSIIAVVFFITSLGLAVVARQQADLSIEESGLIQNLDEITQAPTAIVSEADELPFAEAFTEESLANFPTESDIPVVETESVGDIPSAPETMPGTTEE
ncbi:preprotein translocase subunit SecG [Gammaproteobacteria bacterium]|nr:preprotein translocase subunit SecG [Gammaproteobacteria bacterium]